ncbi:hypothetical protein PAMC26577_37595 [Caballeronia sordidicola]|uniref:Uncharacterized protein n=1 Tax=Caballeronia sordidicola TaxID=196367 RepID=A0A242M624_CABSO|nr:hypothetical protein PAMC26577_37595 [Caballeronia sordidicola]
MPCSLPIATKENSMAKVQGSSITDGIGNIQLEYGPVATRVARF